MPGKTIVIIEDDEKNTKLMRAILEKERYRVISATDARMGIELVREHMPFLILMDIQLPGMDGLSATRLIKRDPAIRDITIVGVSAHAMDEDIDKAFKAGCNEYITKPIDVHTFLERIRDAAMKRERERARTDGGSDRNCKRILVVDDNPLNVKLFSGKLEREGYETIPAYNGREALAKVIEHSTDVILLDLMMPIMDGFEVLERLKSNPTTKNIPVIVITALSEAEERLDKLEAKADELLAKPVSTVELLMRVRSMLHLREIKDQLDGRKNRLSSTPALEYKEPARPVAKKEAVVLLVEDEDKDAKLIATYLAELPYRMIRAKDGEEALLMIEKEQVDLILLDIILPGIDGFEICRRIKSSDETNDIQIIAVTNVSDLENKERSIELGMDEYLIKPVNKQELRIRVKACMSRKLYIEQIQSHSEEPTDTLV
jgi:CheY-like chemotaxis protein